MAPTAASAPTKPGLVARPPLDAYKKVAIIRSKTDGISYEDAEGNIQRISDLGDAATTAAPALKPKKKLEIPVPLITEIGAYETDVPPTYRKPEAFVRHVRPTVEEIEVSVEYNLDGEDEAWLENHPRFGPKPPSFFAGDAAAAAVAASANIDGKVIEKVDSNNLENKTLISAESKEAGGSSALRGEGAPEAEIVPAEKKKCPQCSKPMDNDDENGLEEGDWFRPALSFKGLEQMIDTLEKATGFETIITTSQAERLIIERIPQLLHVFGSGGGDAPNKGEKKRKKNDLNVRTVINEVYNYWVQKRSKLRKPLLRKYWPVTSTNDTNPHLVFRGREKEKYKLRKKRQNDMDAYRKMKQLRKDFDQMRVLLELVRKRERINHCMVEMQLECFEQRMYDLTDTSGLPRISYKLDRDTFKKVVDVPKMFDTKEIGRKKKRKRGTDSRSSSPTPDAASSGDLSKVTGGASEAHITVAGENNGLPAPLYVNPLDSRESYVTEWNNVTGVPAITSYVDSHPVPTFRFRHRPRVGRGGRIVIDRHPCPPHPEAQPVNVFTVGEGLGKCGDKVEPAQRLLQLLPKPLDQRKVSKRIELICAEAMEEDEELGQEKGAVTNAAPSGSSQNDAENDGELVLVPLEDWLETPEQLWGEERFAIGPI